MLETRRLLLRAPQRTDAASIARALSDYEVSRMLARVPSPYLPEDATDWLSGLSHGLGDECFAFMLVCDGEVVGNVGFDWRERGLEIGYWLARAHWGQGLMSEAVSAALIWYFEAVPGGEILSGVLSDNPASLRLQEKLGFAVTGLSEIFSLARNASQRRIETRIDATCFTPVAAAMPAAYRHVL